MGPVNGRRLTLLLPLILAACSGGGDEPVEAQRVSLDGARNQPGDPLPSPDTSQARWMVARNGQAIDFGVSADKPMLTLACEVRANPPKLRIIRHVVARPNEKALLPVLGYGNSRFAVDATLSDGEWRWEGALPASDRAFDVFETTGKIEATLPGGGSLQIDGSRIPGEFVDWCRAGGQTQRPEGAEAAEDAEQAREARAKPRTAPPAR